jgi:hypothetical protein
MKALSGEVEIETQAKRMQGALMITAKQIRELLEGRPFRPFRICMSDGTHRDLLHHHMAWVLKGTVEIGINLDADGFAEAATRCSILHITRLEDIPQAVAG